MTAPREIPMKERIDLAPMQLIADKVDDLQLDIALALAKGAFPMYRSAYAALCDAIAEDVAAIGADLGEAWKV